MRRRPYSELLELGSPTGGLAVNPAKTKDLPPGEQPSIAPLSAETALRYREEIKKLTCMIQQHSMTADDDDRNTCSYIGEKLAAASSALDRGDEDASWVDLYGAATLWQNTVNTSNSERALQRINLLLG